MNARPFLRIMTICLVAFGFHANAQVVIKAGVNFASIGESATEPTYTDYENKSVTGFQGGIAFDAMPTSMFSIQPELLYSMEGEQKVAVSSVKYNLNYLDLPILLQYMFDNGLRLEGGPQIGFLVSAETKTKVDGYGSSKVDIKDNFESIDFGLNFGAGYDFTENFSAGVRYNLGLANIAKTEEGDDSKVHNGVFSLSAAYKF